MDAQDFALQVLEDLQGLRQDLLAHRDALERVQQTHTVLEQAAEQALGQQVAALGAVTQALLQQNQLLAILIQTLRAEPGRPPPAAATGFIDDMLDGMFGGASLAPRRRRRRAP